MLNDQQKNKALLVWENYKKSNKEFKNANQIISQSEIDKERNKVIPICNNFINSYLSNKLTLEVFKIEIDGLNKKNRLWGFKGINGQMYFNMLYNSSIGAGLLDKLDNILKESIIMPNNITEAKNKIDILSKFSDSLTDYASDKRSAPRTGSCLFFITYFWQIQDKDKWPIYYKSMIDVLQDLDLWSASGEYSKDYEDFYNLNIEFITIFDKNLKYWDIEHAFWIWAQKNDESSSIIIDKIKHNDNLKLELLPSSYIPPVVSTIPLLALNSKEIEMLCEKSGISISKAFEERINMLFKMLGYKVENLGQGYGRVPDGIAICSEYHYALIFDAKARENGYSLGTDDRSIKEYIFEEADKLKKNGIKNIYFLVISSFFKGEFEDIIRSIKMETEIRELIFIEASSLLIILEQKLRNPDLDLGPKGVQSLFAQSGILTNSDVKEFLGV